MASCVLVHKEYGIYLGSASGRGFWSQIDPAGQSAAITFPSPEEAFAHAATWENPIDLETLRCVEVVPDIGDLWASIEACVCAGLSAWHPHVPRLFANKEEGPSVH